MSSQPTAVRSTVPDPAPGRRHPPTAGHIAGLDGVRAIAVIAVVAFHLWPARLPGGFIGVDVFFVISGFLITTLLVREKAATGGIALASFWLRRARRLLPALLLVVMVSVVAARLVSSDLMVGIDRQTVGALTFSSNWVEIGAGADYFNHTSPALFATFWSLAVEEQFYLLWPLVLLAILTLVRPGWPRARVVLGAAVVSAALMAVRFEPGTNPTRVYYGTDTHFFGLMLGAGLALAFADGIGLVSRPRWARIRRWAGFVALAGLVVLVLVIDSSSTFTYRGGLVLASLLSAVLVACLPGPRTALSTALRLRPLAWVGERSYGIYLWHWPVILVIAAARPAVAPGEPPDTTTVLLSVGLTLALAAASYRWIEMPIRRHGLAGVRGLFGGVRVGWTAVGALVLAAFAVVATAPDKSAAQLAVEAGQRAIAAQPAAAQATPSVGSTTGADEPAWRPGRPLPSGNRIVAFGDSVLSGAAPALLSRFPGIALDAEPIRQWRDAPALVGAAVDAGTVRPVVVLQFGTNAGLQSDESRRALETVLDQLGPARRVVLVTVVGESYWVPTSNAILEEIAADRPNVAVADWHAVVDARPDLLHSDRTHPNEDGIVAYAELLARTLEELGPGPG